MSKLIALTGALIITMAFDVKIWSTDHLWFALGTGMVAAGSFMVGRDSR